MKFSIPIKSYLVVFLILVVSSGCQGIKSKAYYNDAFVKGQQLIDEGELVAGMQSLEQATQEEPNNIEIRGVFKRQQSEITGRLLAEADNMKLYGDLDAAEQQYNLVLDLIGPSQRAADGLESIALARRHIATIEYVEELLAHDDLKAAETAIRGVLQENPMQPEARQLITQLTSKIARIDESGLLLKTAFKKPLTMEFKDTDMKSVFEIIAKTAGINFIFDKDIRQEAKVSIFVRDNSIEDVLKLLLMTNQLSYKALNDNSLLIYPNTPAKRKEYQELAVRSFQIAYADVKQMVAMVRGLVKAKDIYVNESLNLFVMRDTPEAIRLVERLVTLNDLPEAEVMLEVAVLEISRTNDMTFGPNMPTSAIFSAVPGAGVTVPLDAIGTPGLESFTIQNNITIDFEKIFSQADLLANPRIRVKNRETAKIHIGQKEPVFTVTNTANVGSASSATYIDVGIKLDVEPVIGLNHEVTMKIALEVSANLGVVVEPSSGATAIRIGTRTAETMLTLKDGETQVLAGLINDETTKAKSGIMGLFDIPVLGDLFSSHSIKTKKSEIILLITPRVIRNTNRMTNAESEFHFGTANAAGKLPVSISTTSKKSLAIASSGTGRGAASTRNRSAQAFDPSNDASRSTSNPFARTGASPTISLQAPSNIALDKEFSVRVGLIGASATLTTEMQLSYDTGSLELLNEADNSGMHSLKLGKDGDSGRTAQLRFKVIAANPGTTEITVQNILSEDNEADDDIDIEPPAAATINIK